MNLEQIQSFCGKYNIKPRDSMGQNFLVCGNVLEKIIQAADLKTTDEALEVGPGLGVLTGELLKRVKKVVAVELDKKLYFLLKEQIFKGEKKLEIINADILKINFEELNLGRNYKIVANLPYLITSRFLRLALTAAKKPKKMVLMLQKEVAERICAQPGQMSLLSLSAQYYGQPKIIAIAPKSCFWPKPDVDSAILEINLFGKNILESGIFKNKNIGIKDEHFFRIARIGFSAKRKQLQNNLANGLKIKNSQAKEILEKSGINHLARAQELSIKDWLKLAEKIK